MEFFRRTTKIDFLRIRSITAVLSCLVVVASIVCLCIKGINWSLDFTGGIVVELGYKEEAPLPKIRSILQSANYHEAIVQSFGSPKEVIIRLAARKDTDEKVIAQDIIKLLTNDGTAVELRRVDAIGAQVGAELAEQGSLAIFVALIATMIYIAMRFETRFAVSAAVALAHDPIVILLIFSLFQIEFDLTTLAGILAVIGYSLNDTIVVFDRVKENFIKLRKASPLEIVNLSINQTLSRTIMTSGLTLLVVIALLIFGGPTLRGFSLSLFIGILVGTYSSIYIAGALALALGLNKADLLPKKKEVDYLP
ncbi:MAG: protein translocase subunit SecF [Gammaproteobacteria bacterium]|nr:protein translocase subunit SecF [Gammaproteobacteria bacterium]